MGILQRNVILCGFQIPIHWNNDENNDSSPILSNYDLIKYDVSNLYLHGEINHRKSNIRNKSSYN